jgi:hypothetical protein
MKMGSVQEEKCNTEKQLEGLDFFGEINMAASDICKTKKHLRKFKLKCYTLLF